MGDKVLIGIKVAVSERQANYFSNTFFISLSIAALDARFAVS